MLRIGIVDKLINLRISSEALTRQTKKDVCPKSQHPLHRQPQRAVAVSVKIRSRYVSRQCHWLDPIDSLVHSPSSVSTISLLRSTEGVGDLQTQAFHITPNGDLDTRLQAAYRALQTTTFNERAGACKYLLLREGLQGLTVKLVPASQHQPLTIEVPHQSYLFWFLVAEKLRIRIYVFSSAKYPQTSRYDRGFGNKLSTDTISINHFDKLRVKLSTDAISL
ncbi:hypothetical protein DFQ26_003600 [Actinomortierella ambigua]|nr:hypothetical protein DFQ26_003600 [Actinomortierella ambigua]